MNNYVWKLVAPAYSSKKAGFAFWGFGGGMPKVTYKIIIE
jgi:hypothetical protein